MRWLSHSSCHVSELRFRHESVHAQTHQYSTALTSPGILSVNLGSAMDDWGRSAAKVWRTEMARSSISLAFCPEDLEPVRTSLSRNLGDVLAHRRWMTEASWRSWGELSRTDLRRAKATKRWVSCLLSSSACMRDMVAASGMLWD